jgi:L-asparaginase
MTIRLIATGGTFDKRYEPLRGQLGFGESVLPQMLQTARARNIKIDISMLIDSLDMTDSDRQQIVAACRRAEESQIVIVHGTDTMTQTADALIRAGLNKTIVLTGAMVPALVHDSDAPFNLGFALACAQCLAAGVWITMNAGIFAAGKVRKNRELGIFEALL